MSNCGQACPYNTLSGCKVEEYHSTCPLSNIASTDKKLTTEEKLNKLIEIIEFLVDVDHGITEQHANWIYEMLNELKEE